MVIQVEVRVRCLYLLLGTAKDDRQERYVRLLVVAKVHELELTKAGADAHNFIVEVEAACEVIDQPTVGVVTLDLIAKKGNINATVKHISRFKKKK